MFITMKEILEDANKHNYAVAAPNVFNFETARAAIKAAEEEHAPIIVDIAAHHLTGYIKGEYIPLIVRKMAEEAKIPVAMNLDHGKDFGVIAMAVQYGFNSVMIDASVYPNDENIARTQEVVKLARPLNITVEAEIGHVGVGSKYSIKDYSKYYTDPQEAQHFVAVTGVDALAVAVGTAHGVYKGVPKIDFDRLKELKATLQMPLVLHGGSGTGDENLQKAVEYGINKVNLYTDLHSASYEQLVKTIQEKPKAILIELQEIIENAFKEKLQYYMRLFGSAGRA